jgi:FkbM family methyltransferase
VFKVDNDVIADGLHPRARDKSDDYEETAGMHCNRYTKASLRSYMHTCGFTALSGHFFVPNLSIAWILEGTPWAWWIAIKRGCPILRSAMWQRERFEYAMSWDEIRRKQNSKREKLWLAIRRPSTLSSLASRIGKRMILVVSHLLGYHRRNDAITFGQKSEPQWLRVGGGPLEGHYMLLNLSGSAFWNREMMEGCYDSCIYDAICELVPIQGAMVWDVGAHIGYHSLAFAALVGPSGRVVGFEPNPHNIDRFRQHLERNSDLAERIRLVTCALGSIDGEADFVFSPEIDNGRSSGSHLKQALVPEEPRAYQSFSQTKVSVVTAETMLRDESIPAPSIIKIDVEGAEALVLAGARNLLSSLRPLLIIEVHHIIAMHDTLNILLRLGYHTKIINGAPNSISRCFIVAQAENSHSLNGVRHRANAS